MWAEWGAERVPEPEGKLGQQSLPLPQEELSGHLAGQTGAGR